MQFCLVYKYLVLHSHSMYEHTFRLINLNIFCIYKISFSITKSNLLSF